MSERRIINPDEPVNADALSEIIKMGGSVVFDPGAETEVVQHSTNIQRDVYTVPGYREGGEGQRAGFRRGFDHTVIGPQSKETPTK